MEKPANEDYEEEEEDEEYAAARRVEDPEEDPIEGQYRLNMVALNTCLLH